MLPHCNLFVRRNQDYFEKKRNKLWTNYDDSSDRGTKYVENRGENRNILVFWTVRRGERKKRKKLQFGTCFLLSLGKKARILDDDPLVDSLTHGTLVVPGGDLEY